MGRDDTFVFGNIFNVLLKILNHSSMNMKKQSIKTLHRFIQFVITKKDKIISKEQIICLIKIIFEKMMFEQNKNIKEEIEVLRDNDYDEYQMHLQYKSYMNNLDNIWNWICCHLHDLIQINDTNSLPKEYQKMILKLFESFQKYATFKKTKEEKNEEQQLPTQQLLAKIEAMKDGKTEKTKKRKKMNDDENDIQPPSKKRKLNSQ